jgi:hypothetical protein
VFGQKVPKPYYLGTAVGPDFKELPDDANDILFYAKTCPGRPFNIEYEPLFEVTSNGSKEDSGTT